jgi:hypothetical protein
VIDAVANKPVVLSLCDLTGNFVQPWVEAGYCAVLVDPQHIMDHIEGPVVRLAKTVEDAMPELSRLLHISEVALVAAFPPCTDLAVSGARWFKRKAEADPLFQARAGMLAESCRTIGAISGAPWFVENPVSVLSSLWGSPDFTFQPWHYTGWQGADNYTKKTCLWAGGGFTLPPERTDPTLPEPDDRIHKAPPGPERANFRSATPMGFSRAVFAEMVREVAVA